MNLPSSLSDAFRSLQRAFPASAPLASAADDLTPPLGLAADDLTPPLGPAAAVDDFDDDLEDATSRAAHVEGAPLPAVEGVPLPAADVEDARLQVTHSR